MNIGAYSLEEYLHLVESFHGNLAPGLVVGGFMVEAALRHIPKGVLFDAICETTSCLPDAIQLLTPCTVGNGWLRVMNLGRYAFSLYDKYEGNGIRVFLHSGKLSRWPEVEAWLLKLKTKAEQDKDLLLAQIREAGLDMCEIQAIRVQPQYLKKRSRGRIIMCPLCGEPYPARDGGICRACQGESPYVPDASRNTAEMPPLTAVDVEEAVGRKVLHDMTAVVAGKSKGPAFRRGQRIDAGDVCRLQRMGRQRVYVEDEKADREDWVHEDEAAVTFAGAIAGEGVCFSDRPREGKIGFIADRDGLFTVEESRLERFNMIPGVMCATQRGYTLVRSGRNVAGTRAIPLFLPQTAFRMAMSVLEDGPILRVLSLRKARAGILVTGSEVFQGLIEDRFIPIITAKLERFDSGVVKAIIVPDDREAISEAVQDLIAAGSDLLVTTAGLSVDPDDVTRQGLLDAGAEDMLYGAPILPGAMTLLARIGHVQVLGVPACALYFKTTSMDVLLPRLLAGLRISRGDLSRLGHGGFCLECKARTYPKCPFGK
jgi:formylmethanofuran dehydrogenase subunit E